jgi:multisubunit Na+/H+ antiporter MnhB subunit
MEIKTKRIIKRSFYNFGLFIVVIVGMLMCIFAFFALNQFLSKLYGEDVGFLSCVGLIGTFAIGYFAYSKSVFDVSLSEIKENNVMNRLKRD